MCITQRKETTVTKIGSFIHVILLHFKGKNTDVCSEHQDQRQPPTPSSNGKHMCTHGISNTCTASQVWDNPVGSGDPARLKGSTFPLSSCASDLSQRSCHTGHQQKYRQRKAQHVTPGSEFPGEGNVPCPLNPPVPRGVSSPGLPVPWAGGAPKDAGREEMGGTGKTVSLRSENEPHI